MLRTDGYGLFRWLEDLPGVESNGPGLFRRTPQCRHGDFR
jgi:hypothetical protein